MKFFVRLIVPVLCVLCACHDGGPAVRTGQPLEIWFDKPASVWEETLPLGNGRLGAMPDGGVTSEMLVLNDITLWSGGPQESDKEGALEWLPTIRELIFAGKNKEAESLVNRYFVCQGKGTNRAKSKDLPYGSYQMLAELHLDYGLDGVPETYRRSLDLSDALATTVFTLDGVTYTREYFTDFAEDVIVVRLTADRKGKISVKASLQRENADFAIDGKQLVMTGQLTGSPLRDGMHYAARLQVLPKGGRLTAEDGMLCLEGADEAVLLVSAATDYLGGDCMQQCATLLENAASMRYSRMKQAHETAYRAMFDRVTLELASETPDLTTPERLARFTDHPEDAAFAALYYQFGRYLSICSTRVGLLPPNLQGLWSDKYQTPWNGDYHCNINVQMNHWPVETGNLSELHLPLTELVRRMVEPGRKTAQTYYGARGWVAHSITNLWSFTSPGEQASWGSTTSGAAWLSEHLWEHYAFTMDTAYLASVYPVMKESAAFFLDMLYEEPSHGWLVTVPTTSPENSFIMPTGESASICAGSTMDNQLVRELFTHVTEAAALLHCDAGFCDTLAAARAKLPPTRIGKYGQVMEWLEDYEESDPQHRHISPLFGLYPGTEITPSGTPELAEAARVTLERRGDGSTGWSRAWKINFWARLGDGNHAYKILSYLISPTGSVAAQGGYSGGSYPNLFDAHPPFQIDGNYGGTAGIAEMLLQSHGGFIECLPAVPDCWPTGSYTGLCARGGIQVDAAWRDGRLNRTVLRATASNNFRLKMPAGATGFSGGNSSRAVVRDGMAEIRLEKGESAEFVWTY